MKPWVHTDKSRMSSVGAALTTSAFVLVSCRCGSWLFVRWESVAPLGLFYALRFHRYKRKIGTRDLLSSAYFDF